jgi:hypothetical protein
LRRSADHVELKTPECETRNGCVGHRSTSACCPSQKLGAGYKVTGRRTWPLGDDLVQQVRSFLVASQPRLGDGQAFEGNQVLWVALQ